MKKLLLVLVGTLVMAYGMAQVKPQVVAHRGFWKSESAAQNSMASLMSAMQENFYGTEFDAQLTADSLFVVFHDTKIDGQLVETMQREQLRKHALENGEPIPTVKDYLSEFKENKVSKTKLIFELKPQSTPEKRDLAIRQAMGMVKTMRLEDRVEFISFDYQVCVAMARHFPNTPVFYLGGDRSPKELVTKGIDGIDYRYDVLHRHPEWVRDAHHLGMKVNVWTLNDRESVMEMASRGVDYITTDEPMLVRAWLDELPEYKVVSFNIRMSANAAYDGINAWPNRRETVVKMLREQQPDMLGVQEMLPDQKTFLCEALKDQYDMVGVGRDNGVDEGECMAVFYRKDRLTLLDGKTYWLSETPGKVSRGWDAACHRTVTVAHLRDKTTRKDFYYFNTHLDHVGKNARRESVLLLIHLIDSIVPAGIPVILGGDMNSALSDEIFAPLVNGKGSMKPARELTLQTDHHNTFTGYDKEPHTCIDHFFVNKQVHVLTFQTMNQDFGIPFISDHYPIMIQVSLEGK